MSRQTLFIQDYVELKTKIRQSGLVTADTRERMWPILPQIDRASGPQEYPDVLASAERLRRMLPSRIGDFGNLSAEDRHAMLLHSFTEAKGQECTCLRHYLAVGQRPIVLL